MVSSNVGWIKKNNVVASRRYGKNQAALKTKRILSQGLLKKAVQQGRRGFGARSVHGVREGERREERQVCERRGLDKALTCLREAATAKADRLFQQSRNLSHESKD